jgi:hypothetical protein
MDDPTLAARLRDSWPPAAESTTTTTTAAPRRDWVEEELGEVAPAPVASVAAERLATSPDAAPVADDAGVLLEEPGIVPPTVHDTEPRRFVAVLVTVLPAIYGAGLAYYLAGEYGRGHSTWPIIGAAIGLLVGWGCLEWVRRKD